MSQPINIQPDIVDDVFRKDKDSVQNRATQTSEYMNKTSFDTIGTEAIITIGSILVILCVGVFIAIKFYKKINSITTNMNKE